jgi:hypothetical protein
MLEQALKFQLCSLYFSRWMNFSRDTVPASVISDIKDIFFAFPEQSERVYNSIMEREGNPVEVRRRAEVWVKIFIQ